MAKTIEKNILDQGGVVEGHDHSARPSPAGAARKTHQPFTVPHFRVWAKGLFLDNGEPWEIETFQARFLADVFSGISESLLVIPEGNAKTTFVGGLLLYHLEFMEYARVVVAASSRDQAEWLYQAAAGFVDRSELKQFKCQEGYRRIKCEKSGSRAQIFAADDRTGDGVIPTLAILEELHRHRNLNLYRTWRGKLEKRGGQLISISTAGEPDGEFEALRRTMRDTGTVTRKGSFLRALGPNSVLHEYAVPESGNPDNLKEVKAANPLKAITIETLKRKKSSPAMTPGHWRRFVCGMPASLESWLEAETWDGLRADVGGLRDGDRVYLAIRVGAGAGIGIASPRDDGRIAVGAEIIPAPEQGRLSFEGLEWSIRRLTERYKVESVLYDPKYFMRSAEILQQAGIPMMEAPQTPIRYAEATATLWRLISAGLIVHDGDEALRREVLAGQTKETEQGWRLVATEQTRALIALALAVHQASAQLEPTSYWAL